MKIGLVRHFKVKQEYPRGKRFSAAEVKQWFIEYDAADIEEGSTYLGGIEWQACYSSNLPRAVHTAGLIYDGMIDQMPQLREIPAPAFNTSYKLPFLWWAILIRLSWLLNRQTRLDIKEAIIRINKVLDKAISGKEENVLIVSHAALMVYMRKELIRRGFQGPKFKYADNGKLYVFERE